MVEPHRNIVFRIVASVPVGGLYSRASGGFVDHPVPKAVPLGEFRRASIRDSAHNQYRESLDSRKLPLSIGPGDPLGTGCGVKVYGRWRYADAVNLLESPVLNYNFVRPTDEE